MSLAPDLHDEDRLLPWKKVRDLTGLSRTTAWRRQKAGDFPPPVVISPGRVGWRESEISAWKASRAPRSASPVPVRAAQRTFALEPIEPQAPEERAAAAPSASQATAPEPARRRAVKPSPPDQMSLNF